jgi:hypothetical protein
MYLMEFECIIVCDGWNVWYSQSLCEYIDILDSASQFGLCIPMEFECTSL